MWMRAVEDRSDLLKVTRREAIQLEVLAALDVGLALGDLVGRDAGRREQLHQVRAGEVLQRAGGRMVDHLIDLELVVARAGLQEEVVNEILDQVSRGEHVVARPGSEVRVLNQRARPPAMKCCVLRTSLTPVRSPSSPGSPSTASVSMVLIADETSSMWPSSTAAMLATRS
jgi:hypothetical protein